MCELSPLTFTVNVERYVMIPAYYFNELKEELKEDFQKDFKEELKENIQNNIKNIKRTLIENKKTQK
jgi:mRNA-degrading endonuclease RelE of RelBE toxin-antitoxin system